MANSSKEGTRFSPLSHCPKVPGDTVWGKVGGGGVHVLTTVRKAKCKQSQKGELVLDSTQRHLLFLLFSTDCNTFFKNRVWNPRTFGCCRNLLLTFRTRLPKPGVGIHRLRSLPGPGSRPSVAGRVHPCNRAGHFISLRLLRAHLFNCLCLKQTVGIAHSFDFDLEILFMQNGVS